MRHAGEHGTVELRIFAQQVRLMREVERRVAHPRRQLEIILAERLHLGGELQQLGPHGVVVTGRDPRVGHVQAVAGEGGHVTPPHLGGRMVAPAVGRQRHRAQQLQRLHALLAEPRAVEHGRALAKRRKRQEGLHQPFAEAFIAFLCSRTLVSESGSTMSATDR
jgi:hypothetical protein